MDLGVQRLDAGVHIERHRHPIGHLTLVLHGAYAEAGDEGSSQTRPGTLVAHRPFSAHRNRIDRDSIVLNLPAHNLVAWSWATCRDADAILRLAEHNLAEAASCALDQAEPFQPVGQDWEDLLAATLSEDPTMSISAWAAANGLRKEQVSRGFRERYGVSPKRYRAERRAYLAWRRMIETSDSPCKVAAELGFADQPHMTRAVRALTGAPPGAWR